MIVRIKYVDEQVIECKPEDWVKARADGVDWVEIQSGPGTTRVANQSVYWLYPENGAWVLGGGPVGYGELTAEVVARPDRQEARRREYMPDLPHASVKLGHWWSGPEVVRG